MRLITGRLHKNYISRYPQCGCPAVVDHGSPLRLFRKWSGYSHYDRRLNRQQEATSFSEMEIAPHARCGQTQESSSDPCTKRTLVGIPEMRSAEVEIRMPIIHSYIIFRLWIWLPTLPPQVTRTCYLHFYVFFGNDKIVHTQSQSSLTSFSEMRTDKHANDDILSYLFFGND